MVLQAKPGVQERKVHPSSSPKNTLISVESHSSSFSSFELSFATCSRSHLHKRLCLCNQTSTPKLNKHIKQTCQQL